MKSVFPYNYHSHTKYCDGAHHAEEYITAAINLGYQSYGFSTHAPIPEGSVWNMKESDLELYLNEIKSLKQKYAYQIELYIGLEIDYVDGEQGPSSYSQLLDYNIGSIHFMGYGKRSELFEMDGSFSKFSDGLDRHYENDLRRAVEHYFQLTTDMIQNDPPEILGHVDKIISNAIKVEHQLLATKWYIDLMEALAKIISKKEMMVEINTRGLKSSFFPTTYPHQDFLKILSQYPIRFQMNADVHRTSDLDMGYQKTLEMIRHLGIKELWVMENHEWKAKRI